MSYIDLLTQLKNAQAVKKETVKSPYSKMDEKVLEVLLNNNYVESFEKKGKGAKKVLLIKIKYDNSGGVITGVKFISKPSRRLYVGYKDIRRVKSGYGLSVISTPTGIITGSQAKKLKVGGEILFEIW
ncbi:30S ribosomal protein S8 [Candidatus Wolfebacteria bacterium]|nr:30S ribosomal protein S8 [Candidatus Wolfebacteria bacterium]